MPFRDVIGHRRLIGLLARSIREQSLPPSLIFAGPDGVGKRLVAIAAAQELNCLAAQDTACGVCAACTRIARGVHPDVMLIEPGDNGSIKIDQIREIVERVAYRPFEGRRRVVIINEADTLVPQAQNALLKTLEEPPSGSVFMLLTSKPDSLLATVRSRCPRLRFRPLDADDVATALVKHGKSEPEARAAAATSGGSVGAALEAAGADLVDARDAAVRVLTHAAASDDPRRKIAAAEELVPTGSAGMKARDHVAMHLRAMSSIVRDVELLSAGGDAGTLANADVRPALERLTAFHGQRGVEAFAASIARWRRSTETLASRSSPTGWCCSYEPREPGEPGEPVNQFVSVKLSPVGRAQTFSTELLDKLDGAPRPGDRVVVQTENGQALGTVVPSIPPIAERRRTMDSANKAVRLASHDDIITRMKQEHREREAYRVALLKIREHGLGMKLARVEQAFDGSRLVFYFTAEGRVDFRDLVRELASEFRTRIELRQIGVRDEAKMLGGYGTCGRPLCCTTFLTSFEPVSIKMAKQQDLSLNPSKLSGLCGRLKCCLRYELPNAKGEVHGGCGSEGGCDNPSGCGSGGAAAAAAPAGAETGCHA